MSLDAKIKTALSSLQRFIYIRAENPAEMQKEILGLPNMPKFPDIGPLEQLVVTPFVEIDRKLKDHIGKCVSIVNPGQFDSEEMAHNFERMEEEFNREIRCCWFLITIGTEPATKVIPPHLRYLFYPIDLVETNVETGLQIYRRPTTEDALMSLVHEGFKSFFTGKAPPDVATRIATRLQKLSLAEARWVMQLSILEERRLNPGHVTWKGRGDQGVLSDDIKMAAMANPVVCAQYRERWSHVC